ETVWNPETDPLIAKTYSAGTVGRKQANRLAVQSAMKLEPDPSALLFTVVSRLSHQKGLDLLAAALPGLVARGGQLALLGSGDSDLEALFRRAAAEHPGRVAVRIGYDELLSHLLIAGGDAIMVPSRFEPCGLTQLYGLRYGTIPIVARTGGLYDSVIDANAAGMAVGAATGILFGPDSFDEFARALGRAFDLFADHAGWQSLMRAAMSPPGGWGPLAGQDTDLFEQARGSSGQ